MGTKTTNKKSITNLKILLIKLFANLKLAISFLLLIAVLSIIGTIIEQNQPLSYYITNYSNPFFITTIPISKIIFIFGFDHIFTTSYYLGLLGLFGTCLICCTTLQQFPLLRNAKQIQFQFNSNEFKKQSFNTRLDPKQFFLLFDRLKIKQFIIFQQQKTYYAYKGLLGRFAPIIVHFSIILILIGTTIASVTQFNSQELQPKGEVFELQAIVTQGPLTSFKSTPFRINDFWVQYDEKEKIKQFYTDFSILNNNGNEIKQKTLNVNLPLRYKNLTIYQTDWNLLALRLNYKLKTYQIPLTSLDNKKLFWVGWLPIENNDDITLLINKFNGLLTIYENGKILSSPTLNSKLEMVQPLKIEDIITETGLQIKMDLGVPLIYAGFGLLMISSLISYISYTQIWVLNKNKKFIISGKTNRAFLNLQLEFLKINPL